jgi:hypothetical protein
LIESPLAEYLRVVTNTHKYPVSQGTARAKNYAAHSPNATNVAWISATAAIVSLAWLEVENPQIADVVDTATVVAIVVCDAAVAR